MTPRTYVASPLGFTEAGRAYYAQTLLPTLATVVEVVDPWALTAAEEVERLQAAGRHAELNTLIGARNAEAIRSCTRLVAVLDGQEPDAGTCAEIGYAAGLGLRIDGLRTDWREAGEAGATVNLQVQYFVEASGGRIADSLDALVALLRDGV
ncbi:nucleoside 2-deoxyribosyltransferase [Paraconexibacter algicola]|uniref:2-deoxyribonucleoside glycosidase n=1 Tax=Paraconexibacter algicola TaxID=2133960 RepID=A0A2T4ULN1_9ACTN|nr:nucleoside 2-deoxyribosyltransferase [Paraconexibacter algicola]PTL60140.1 2-deoxyribonucleoside glycosidase [Paraconexibacter algicola]